MIRAESHSTNYETEFSNGAHRATSDATPDKDGATHGFRPHELLEAALATCMNMTLRLVADTYGIPLSGLSITVSLNREKPQEPVIEYRVQCDGALSEAQQSQSLSAAERRPVRNTLSQPLRFMPCSRRQVCRRVGSAMTAEVLLNHAGCCR